MENHKRMKRVTEVAEQTALEMTSKLATGDKISFADVMSCLAIVTGSVISSFKDKGFNAASAEIILDTLKKAALSVIEDLEE